MSKPKKKPAKPAAAKKPTPAKPKAAQAVKASFASIVKAAGGKKLVLHIGCGAANPAKLHQSFQGPEWHEVRLDIDASVKPDIVADMIDMSAVPDESVDAVWSSHNIEHLYPHDVPGALKEISRVIKNGGAFLVTLPDIQSVANYVAHGNLEEPIYDSPAGPICPIDILYGFRKSMAMGNLFMAHKTAFTAESLARHLRDSGFSNIRVRREWVNLWAVGYKFPHGHPQRIEKTVIETDDAAQGLKLPPAMPVNRSPHPGNIAAGKLSDELDIPPKSWKPLGLKAG